MKNYKKEIIGGIIILFLMVAGFTSVSTSAFRWIGKVKLLDTLNGNLKLNNGLWLLSDSINGATKINTDEVQSGNGIKFASATNYIDDDGGDLWYNATAHIFSSGVSLILPTDSVRFADASKTGTVANAVGYLKVYVGGEVFYIQLYDTH